jgi:hypothetical protein
MYSLGTMGEEWGRSDRKPCDAQALPRHMPLGTGSSCVWRHGVGADSCIRGLYMRAILLRVYDPPHDLMAWTLVQPRPRGLAAIHVGLHNMGEAVLTRSHRDLLVLSTRTNFRMVTMCFEKHKENKNDH